jgi:hypothetical protein
MVHLFSMTRCGRTMSVLARVEYGVYTIESIDGHAAHHFPAFVSKCAQNRVQPRTETGVPIIRRRADIPVPAAVDDFDIDAFSLKF